MNRARLISRGRQQVTDLLPRDYVSPVLDIAWFPERMRKCLLTTIEKVALPSALELEDNEYARHAPWLLLLMGLCWRPSTRQYVALDVR
jgi:hypothetical protein